VPWEDQARCRQYDPELFFDPRARSERRAKSICSRCPVQSDCLLLAMQSHADFGVWGGLTSRERRKLVRQPAFGPDLRPVLQARLSVS
jgi:WhiB family transcriptional regulator, redox-sensing transcriptional regulator